MNSGESNMTASMTGYGRSSCTGEAGTVTVEIKTVNSRFLELNFRSDGISPALEDVVRSEIKKKISRGKAYISIKFEAADAGKNVAVTLDQSLIRAQIGALKEVQRLPEVAPGRLTLQDLMPLSDSWLRVSRVPISDDILFPIVRSAAENAVAELQTMRLREGANLAADLLTRTASLREKLLFLKNGQEQIAAQYEKRLRERIQQMLGASGMQADEGRILEEVAVYAEKTDYTEELVRFESHLGQFESALQREGPSGRRLDFLLQEINREINTMASKANDLTVIDCTIWIKTELEKIREQVQNIE